MVLIHPLAITAKNHSGVDIYFAMNFVLYVGIKRKRYGFSLSSTDLIIEHKYQERTCLHIVSHCVFVCKKPERSVSNVRYFCVEMIS